MKYFIQDAKQFEFGDKNFDFRLTPRYIELVVKENEVLAYVVYLIFRDANSLMVAACWEDMLDAVVIKDEDDVKDIEDTIPTLGKLIRNSMNKRFSQGALARMEDFDNGDLKWFIVSIVGNLNFQSAEDFFQERVMETAVIVLNKCSSIFSEIRDYKPRYLGRIWRNLRKGFMLGVDLNLRYNFADFFDSQSSETYPVSPDSLLQRKTFEEFVQGIHEERQRRGIE